MNRPKTRSKVTPEQRQSEDYILKKYGEGVQLNTPSPAYDGNVRTKLDLSEKALSDIRKYTAFQYEVLEIDRLYQDFFMYLYPALTNKIRVADRHIVVKEQLITTMLDQVKYINKAREYPNRQTMSEVKSNLISIRSILKVCTHHKPVLRILPLKKVENASDLLSKVILFVSVVINNYNSKGTV